MDLLVGGPQTSEINDIVDDILKINIGRDFPLKVVSVRDTKVKIQVNRSAFLMFDSLELYRSFHQRIYLKHDYPSQFHFLVYVKDIKESQAEKLLLSKNFTEDPKIIQYQSFLVHGDKGNTLKVLTFSMFQQLNCRDWITVEINRFSHKLGKWMSHEFFQDKFTNFNGCELIGQTFWRDFPSVAIKGDNIENEPINDSQLIGYIIDFNEELARCLNYALRHNLFNYTTGKPSNRSAPIDYLIMSFSLRKALALTSGVNYLWVSDPFTTSDDVIIMSRFKPYTQFEKFILPFDAEVWHWLIATLLVSVATIFVVKLASRKVQNFVFGRNVSSPMLNFL